MARGARQGPTVPPSIEGVLKQLVITMKAVMLYPGASSIPKENATQAAAMLTGVLRTIADLRFGVQKNGLTYEGIIVFEGQSAFEAFAQDLYNRGLAEVRFHNGVTVDDVLAFLGAVMVPVSELAAAGGMESHLWDLGVDTITVKEASTRLVDSSAPLDSELQEPWPPPPDKVGEIIRAAMGGRPRDQRMLVRVLGDSGAMQAYLMETLTGRGEDTRQYLADLKLDELAHAAMREPRESRAALFQAIAQAIEGLDPDLKRLVLGEKLLPDARTDDALASVVRQLDIDEVCRTLVEGMADDQASIDGLARAIRNLALISLAERERVMDSIGSAMVDAGYSQEKIGSLMEAVSPSQLHVRERAQAQAPDQQIDSILKLVDLAPGGEIRERDDSGFVALQEEARRGITDGDVVAALATLVSVDSRGASFESITSLLDDSIGLLVERGDFTVAADAAASLAVTLESSGLSVERRNRLESLLATMARKDDLAAVARAMRNFPPVTPEHAGCKRLLDTLGERALEPLLEVLADEPDMAARKSLVDLLSNMSEEYVEGFAKHVTDPRWFFVRNVVAILGATRRSGALPALGRTLRHNDPRVRRETVRALARIPDRLSAEMLVAALDDSDAQNVQLAARQLGALQVRGAVAALEQVAKGEGRGNRDTGPRAEAIESLGRLGATESLPLLEAFAGRRPLIGRSTARELKASAEQAIARIKTQGGAA